MTERAPGAFRAVILLAVLHLAGCPRDLYLPAATDAWLDRPPADLMRPPPEPVWAAAPEGSISGTSIALAAGGSCVIAGSYLGKARFGAQVLYAAKPRAFVARLDPGGQFLWARDAISDAESGAAAVAVDAGGGIYVTGRFSGSATFGGQTLSQGELFVAKLDSQGSFSWASAAGSTSPPAQVRDIAVDGSGASQIIGSFAGTASFGGTTLQSAGSRDAFVARLDPGGAFLWARRSGGAEEDQGMGIGLDGPGNSYGLHVESTMWGHDMMSRAHVTKRSPAGETIWTTSSSTSECEALAIAVDAAGQSTITGAMVGLFFSLGELKLEPAKPFLNNAAFVARLDASGVPQWITPLQEKDGIGERPTKVRGMTIALDGRGTSTVGGAVIAATSSSLDALVAGVEPSGAWSWSLAAGGAGSDQVVDIAVDSAGNAWAIGTYEPPAAFGAHTLATGSTFVMRIARSGKP